MSSRYDAVLLDADETIFDFYKAERMSIRSAADEFGVSVTDADISRYSDINLSLWKELEQGRIERNALKTERFSRWFEYLNVKAEPAAFNQCYVRYLSQSGYLIDGALDFVKRLSTLCDLYIVTNGLTASQTGRFNASTVKPYIKKLFISESIGLKKPDKAYFNYVLNDIGITDRSRVIILGDSLSSDMLGGKNAGIVTCRYIRNTLTAPEDTDGLCDYSISDYNDFFAIVGN